MSGHYKIEKTQGKARLFLSPFGWGMRANATCYEDRETAEGYARDVGGIVKRWLTPAESRRKAAAEALRELAVWCREKDAKQAKSTKAWDAARLAYRVTASEAEARADALWPRKGAGRG